MLSGFGHSDYVRDMALHGLRLRLGSRFVDHVRPRHLYRLRDYDAPSISELRDSAKNSADADDRQAIPLAAVEATARAGLYGRGFTFAHRLPFAHDDYCEDARTGASHESSDLWADLFGKHGGPALSKMKAQDVGNGASLDRSEATLRAAIARRDFDVIIFGIDS